jgi:DNA-binding transcriptional LysR family regulator
MDLRQFQYVSAIAKYRNVTKAADSLYISQSALSHYIRSAEDELGVRLFDRSTSPISLTEAGRCYMESAQRILMENERLMKELRDITNHMSGTLKIGTSRDRCSYMIPKLLPEFYSEFPEIRVNVVTGGGTALKEMLRSGEIDMVLLPALPEDRDPSFVYEKLYTEELLLVARKGTVDKKDCMGGHHIVSPKVLDGKSFFIQEQGHIHRRYCDNLFRKSHIRPEIKQVFSSNISCFRMSATGEGMTIVPFMTTQLAYPGNEVELFSIGDPPSTWDIYIIYRKDYYLGVPEKELINLGKKIFSGELRSPAR